MSPSLREIQEQLLAEVQGRRAGGAAASMVAGNARLTPEEQLGIYREMFASRHLESLLDDFPLVASLLGVGAFLGLARSFLLEHPPTTFTLRDLGQHLPGYLERAPLAEASVERALLVDAARLEWALIEAADAAELPPLDPHALASLTPDDLDRAILTFDPALTPLALHHPVHRLLSRLGEPDGGPLPAPRPTFLIIAREPDLEVAWHELPALAHRALVALQARAPLAETLDQLAATLPDEEAAQLGEHLGVWFADWVRLGWVRALDWPPSAPVGGETPDSGTSI